MIEEIEMGLSSIDPFRFIRKSYIPFTSVPSNEDPLNMYWDLELCIAYRSINQHMLKTI